MALHRKKQGCLGQAKFPFSSRHRDTNLDVYTRMEQYLMPFGAGPRVCGGQNLAQIVLRIVIATVVRNFDIVARAAETNERTMDIRDAFVSVYMTAWLFLASCCL